MASSVDESRHVINNLDQSASLLTPDGSALSGSFVQRLRSFRNHLVRLHCAAYSPLTDPDSSVYTGYSGVVMLYQKIGQDPDLEDLQLMSKAEQALSRPRRVSRRNGVTFLCGDVGALALEAVATRSTAAVDKIKDMLSVVVNQPDMADELLYGRVGYLFALLFIKKHLDHVIQRQDIEPVIEAILKSGQKGSKVWKINSPLMYQWHDSFYLGAAHGLIGILFMLLQCPEYLSEQQLATLIRPSVDYVRSLMYPSGNFPSSLGSRTDRLVHWCHGAPGAVHLFLLAAQVFPDKRSEYLLVAEQCCRVIWERGLLKKGYGLCHGISGNAYAFLHCWQVTHDTKYLNMAAKFADLMIIQGEQGCRDADRPYSLFEGWAGTIYFLSDLLQPEKAHFPAFCI